MLSLAALRKKNGGLARQSRFSFLSAARLNITLVLGGAQGQSRWPSFTCGPAKLVDAAM
jgi:hypothetical protein